MWLWSLVRVLEYVVLFNILGILSWYSHYNCCYYAQGLGGVSDSRIEYQTIWTGILYWFSWRQGTTVVRRWSERTVLYAIENMATPLRPIFWFLDACCTSAFCSAWQLCGCGALWPNGPWYLLTMLVVLYCSLFSRLALTLPRINYTLIPPLVHTRRSPRQILISLLLSYPSLVSSTCPPLVIFCSSYSPIYPLIDNHR